MKTGLLYTDRDKHPQHVLTPEDWFWINDNWNNHWIRLLSDWTPFMKSYAGLCPLNRRYHPLRLCISLHIILSLIQYLLKKQQQQQRHNFHALIPWCFFSPKQPPRGRERPPTAENQTTRSHPRCFHLKIVWYFQCKALQASDFWFAI